jgi:hypothetical protein
MRCSSLRSSCSLHCSAAPPYVHPPHGLCPGHIISIKMLRRREDDSFGLVGYLNATHLFTCTHSLLHVQFIVVLPMQCDWQLFYSTLLHGYIKIQIRKLASQ